MPERGEIICVCVFVCAAIMQPKRVLRAFPFAHEISEQERAHCLSIYCSRQGHGHEQGQGTAIIEDWELAKRQQAACCATNLWSKPKC